MFKKWINKIKSDKQLFMFLANELYKFFNIIERNDLIKIPNDPKIYRILDIYSDGSFEMLCDHDPTPMRQEWNGRTFLYKKFFKPLALQRERHDKGWRMFPGGFFNFNTKEIIQRKG